MNDSRLRDAARRGAADFINEWNNQGGSSDRALIDAQYDFFSDPDFEKKINRKGKKSYQASMKMDSNTPTGVGDFMRKGLQSQYADNKGMMGGEFQTIESIADLILTTDNKVKSIKQFFGDFAKNLGQQVILYYEQQNDLLEKTNQKTGILGELSKGFRHEISEASIDAIRLGVGMTELADVMTDIVAESGKFKLMDDATMSKMVEVSKFSESLSHYAKLVPTFEMIGLGVGDMNREIEAAGKSSMVLGLNARKTISMIGDNLEKLNQYGFKKGVDGLKEMTQKSIEFRMNMNEAFSIAEKVWSPEGALEVVSNLQVIGGAFGDLNDPIKLMYMATNNVEGLQDALQGAAKTLVTFNDEQGRFQITGANLRRAKEMADTMGVSFKELTSGAIAAMERTQASLDLSSRGLDLDDKQVEFLTNLARMEDGKMVISVPENLRKQLGMEGDQQNIALENMNQVMAERLIAEQDKLKDKSMQDIAKEQISLVENINRDLSFLTATARIKAGEIGQNLVDALGWDPVKVAMETSKLADKIGTGMVNISDKVLSAEIFNKDKIVQKGNVETGATSAPVNNVSKSISTSPEEKSEVKKTVHEHKISLVMSDNAMDDIQRTLIRDPRFYDDFSKSYLQSLRKN